MSSHGNFGSDDLDEIFERHRGRSLDAVDWPRATVAGFCGRASALGFRLNIGRMVERGVMRYAWMTPQRTYLTGTVEVGDTPLQTFAKICQKAAEWEPDLMIWRKAFNEVVEQKL